MVRIPLLSISGVAIVAASCGAPEGSAPKAPWPVTLPVAPLGHDDKGDDNDLRVVVEVDARGRPRWEGRLVTPKQLADALDSLKRLYELIQTRRDDSAWVEKGRRRWSELYVQIVAGHNTPWADVNELIHFLRRQEFFKLQFAATRDAASSARVKLQVPLRRDDRAPETVLAIEVKCIDGKVEYQLNDHPIGSIKELGERIGDSSPHAGQILARISAPGSLHFMHVVAVVNQLQRTRITDYEFLST